MTTEYSTELFSNSPGGGHGGGREHHFDIKRMLRLRGPVMIVIAVSLAVPLALGVWFLTPIEYQSEAQLHFLVAAPRVMYNQDEISSSAPYDKHVSTQVSLIRGPAILGRVLDHDEVRNLSEIRAADDALGFLQERVRLWLDSEIVTVSCTMQDPKSAQLIVETIVQEYMTYAMGDEAEAESQRLRLLREARDGLTLERDRVRENINGLTRQLDVPLPQLSQQAGPSETSSFYEMLAGALADLSKAESGLSQVQEQLKIVQGLQEQYKQSPGDAIYTLGVEERVTADPGVSGMQQEIVQAESALSVLESRHASTSPQLKVQQERLATLRQNFSGLVQKARGRVLTTLEANLKDQVAAAEKDVANATERRDVAQGRIDEFKTRALDASGTYAELEEQKTQLAETTEMLREVREQIARIEMESQAPARVRKVADASFPAAPSNKKRVQLMLMALVGSIGVGGGFGLLRELMDQQVRSAQDMSSITSVPLIAAIPHSTEDFLEGPVHAPLLLADHPGSTTAEEFRRILARIIYPPESSVEINSCLVTSPMPGDGKTSLACNIAIALSQAKRRVLLIDINTRDHAVEEAMRLEPGPGLSELLMHELLPEQVIRESSHPGLFVLGPGNDPGALIGKLASRDMVDFLQMAEEEFEHVIIDSPPALLMSDAKLVAPVVDGVVVVVGAGISTRGMVQRCLREMEQVGASVIGVVLNGLRPTRGGYMRSNQKMYYGYTTGGANGNGRKADDLPEMVVLDGDRDDESVTMLVEYDSEPEEPGSRRHKS
jgi:capsular exopolysaccharide synthesis family protein